TAAATEWWCTVQGRQSKAAGSTVPRDKGDTMPAQEKAEVNPVLKVVAAADKESLPEIKEVTFADDSHHGNLVWLCVCFLGIVASFMAYGIVLEYATSGGRKLHELSLIFVTSLLYSATAYVGRYARGEEPTTIPKVQMVVLGLTSMGSTFTSVRSLRYVIYPVQVLAKSCKPIPVMIIGAFMGKSYPKRKYLKVFLIVIGVALFMGGDCCLFRLYTIQSGSEGGGKAGAGGGEKGLGMALLFVSLCFDGGTGAYEDKLMSQHHVGPFDLMFNIQFAKTVLAALCLIITGQINYFVAMVSETGFRLLLLGLCGAAGQVFIFLTISKFGALTCSIIGLSRKILTLVASILIYKHSVNMLQGMGLLIAIGAMVSNFASKGKLGGGHGQSPVIPSPSSLSLADSAAQLEEARLLDDSGESDVEDRMPPSIQTNGREVEMTDL
ncbi:unnamed protein product, partial [Chrysoparadoxa australica]